MKQIKTEIIAIGTELLLGQIANTNAKWLSEQLAFYGIDTFYHTVVGDNLNRVTQVFEQAQQRSNVMIVSGGLGPTEDDITREAFQQMTGLSMTYDEPTLHKIESYFANQQLPMTPNNRRQARVFTNAKIIDNKVGMAPGMIIDYQDKLWFFLPGVPREMKQMATDDVFPYIIKHFDQTMVIQSMILRFIGIGEAALEHELQDLIQLQQNPTIAPLAQSDGLTIRLTAKETTRAKAEQLLEETKEQIAKRVGKYLYGLNDETIEETIVRLLIEKNQTIAAAESLTGGLFTEKLISVEGVSKVFPGGIICYDTRIKHEVLNISNELIKSYGVVSKECAYAMAQQVAQKMKVDIGISFTGVAGPETLENKEVGTVYITVFHRSGKHLTKKFIFQGDRQTIRRRATLKGFEMLFYFLKNEINDS